MALHTGETCTIPNPNPNASGQTLLTDCTVTNNPDGTHGNGSGCVVSDPRPESYSSLASANGGIWIAEYGPTAVNIWFFQRSNVPSGLETAETIDTATLGQPVANFPTSSTCDMAYSLDPQHLVIDITLCGNCGLPCSFTRPYLMPVPIGAGAVIADTCGALTETNCYKQYIKDPANFVDAYCMCSKIPTWCLVLMPLSVEIASIKLFGDGTTLLQNGTITPTSASRTSTTRSPTPTVTRAGLSVYTIGVSTSTTTSTSPTSSGHRQMIWGTGSLALMLMLAAATL